MLDAAKPDLPMESALATVIHCHEATARRHGGKSLPGIVEALRLNDGMPNATSDVAFSFLRHEKNRRKKSTNCEQRKRVEVRSRSRPAGSLTLTAARLSLIFGHYDTAFSFWRLKDVESGEIFRAPSATFRTWRRRPLTLGDEAILLRLYAR